MLRPVLALALTLAALPAPAQEVVATGGPDLEAGRDTYLGYCASCHGMDGRGDGPMAPVLTVLPSDLTTLSALNGGLFPWLRTARQIDGRDPFLAHGGVMPLYGDFFTGDPAEPQTAIRLPDGQPMVTTRTIADLLVYLESLQE